MVSKAGRQVENIYDDTRNQAMRQRSFLLNKHPSQHIRQFIPREIGLSEKSYGSQLQLQLQLSSYIIGEGNSNPLQYSCLENLMDGGAWQAAVHGVSRNRTRLSDFTLTFHFHALEKEIATHSSVLAWRIPGTGEPGRLPSMGSHRAGHD